MRATIKAMSIKRQEIDQKIQTNRSELKNVCPVVLVNSIRLKIHDLNSKLFQYLQDHKNQKLFELTGRDPNSNSKPLEQRCYYSRRFTSFGTREIDSQKRLEFRATY